MGKKCTGRLMSLMMIILVVLGIHIRGIYFEQYTTFFIVFTTLVGGLLWYGGLKYDRAVFLSHIDPLTKVYNREYLYENFSKILSQSERNSKNLNIILVDIDKFKEINDNLGHQQGDKVLIELAKVFKKNLRKSDNVVRWGGDEFLLIIPDCNKETLIIIVKRIQEELQEISSRLGINISITIGRSSFPKDGKRMNELISKADIDMYILKERERKAVRVI